MYFKHIFVKLPSVIAKYTDWSVLPGTPSICLQDNMSRSLYVERSGASANTRPSRNISGGGLRVSQLHKSLSHVVIHVISGLPSQSRRHVLPSHVLAHARVADVTL